MACFNLSADKIKAAPPEVRCWLERQILRAFGERPIADGSTKDSVLIGRQLEKPSRDGARRSHSLESSFAAKGNVGMNEINPATRSAAIQKLIAERAYELWENQGRPRGCDLIHWREAEQEIMDCLARTQVDSPIAAGT